MKKGNVLLLEFLIGSLIVLAFFVYILPYNQEYFNEGDELFLYAKESITLLKSTQVSQFSTETRALIPVDYYCGSCAMSEQLARLLINNKLEAALNVSNSTLYYLIPDQFGYALALTGPSSEQYVHIKDGQSNQSLMARSTLVSGLSDDISDVYLLQIRVWG